MKFIGPVDNRKSLIVFVHGLTGGEDTWIRKNGEKSVAEYLSSDKQIREHFDLALYTYDTTFMSLILVLRYFVGILVGSPTRYTRNLPISELAEIFTTELRITGREYSQIIIIAHSMGGLVSKRTILDEIEKSKAEKVKTRIKLLVTLATPHLGAELASFGKFLLKSPQMKDLAPTNEEIVKMNNKWVQSKNHLPKRIFCVGKNDQVVTGGAGGIDPLPYDTIPSTDDHFSVLIPTPNTQHVLNGIKDACVKLADDTIKSEHIQVPEPRRKPFKIPWVRLLVLIVIVVTIVGLSWPKPKPPICTSCAFGLTGYALEKFNENSKDVTVFFNDTSVSNYQTFEHFLLANLIIKQMDSVTFYRSIDIDTIIDPKWVILTINLPEEKTTWGGFVLGVDKNYYDHHNSIDAENRADWSVYPDTSDHKMRFVYAFPLTSKVPIFKILK